jgi:hypothetical protein
MRERHDPTEVLRTAINDWKAKFEQTRWEQWDRLPEEEKRHALEHAMGGYITGVTYPFVKRPAECPLSLFEIGIALWVSEGDFYEAALRLRVSPERLATAIKNVPEFTKYAPNLKQQKRDAGEPLVEVIPRDAGVNFDIRPEPQSKLQRRLPCGRRCACPHGGPSTDEGTGEAAGGTIPTSARSCDGDQGWSTLALDATPAPRVGHDPRPRTNKLSRDNEDTNDRHLGCTGVINLFASIRDSSQAGSSRNRSQLT